MDAASASAVEEGEAHFAVCLASAEVQTPAESPVVSPVGDTSRPICNFVSHALKILTPGLEDTNKPISVFCKHELKDFYTLPREAQKRFADAVAKEFPRGKNYVVSYLI